MLTVSRLMCRWCCVPLIAICAMPPARLAAQAANGKDIELTVDASEAPRRVYRARMVIPASPGPLTLCYPKWIPGTHSPVGPISDVTSLKIESGGKTIPWQRDEEDAYLIHCQVPKGADAVEVSFTPVSNSDGWSPTPYLAVCNWNLVLLYPRDIPAGKLRYHASLRLPEGWKLGTALAIEERQGATTRFAPVSLERLIDSPVLCGAHFREVAVGDDREPRHYVVLAADSEAALEMNPALKTGCDRLVAEAKALFGSRHYSSYRFLLALSDRLSFSGLEHHESSDDHATERALLTPDGRNLVGYLFAHEYIHSWCGKYRRPADMITAGYHQPQRTKLLWVYEGLTDYLAVVLAGRSGLWTPEICRDHLALVGETMNNRRGRSWRPLEDVALAAPYLRGSAEWSSWRRTTFDYYWEGVLLWLEVDMLIREQSHGKASLDDFCRRFFGGEDTAPCVKGYTLEELTQALNDTVPYDWKSFLSRRVAAVADQAPLEGIRLAGWRLGYGAEPTAWIKTWNGLFKQNDLSSSLGMVLRPDGSVSDVIPGRPADKAGISPGMKLLAVNGRRWSEPRLLDALKETKTTGKVELLLENGDLFRTFTLTYNGGARYPRLQRMTGDAPDRLTDLFMAKTKGAAPVSAPGEQRR